MTLLEKENMLKSLATDIEMNRIRLENAEILAAQYLENAKALNERLIALSLEEING